MADPRPQHITHRGPSLLNIPTPAYNGPGASLYGERGPQREFPDYGARGRKALSDAPQSLEHHIQDAIARVPDLSPKQKLALRNTLTTMLRDISFIRMLAEAAHMHGPWSQAAMDSQGNPVG